MTTVASLSMPETTPNDAQHPTYYASIPIPIGLLDDVHDNPNAIGLFLLIARLYLIHQQPIPLSDADIEAYDPALSRGAIRKAIKRLTKKGWIIVQKKGRKNAYLPAWGKVNGISRPWKIHVKALNKPGHVRTMRVDKSLLDEGMGRLSPHPSTKARITRYHQVPQNTLRGIGQHILGLPVTSATDAAPTPQKKPVTPPRNGTTAELPEAAPAQNGTTAEPVGSVAPAHEPAAAAAPATFHGASTEGSPSTPPQNGTEGQASTERQASTEGQAHDLPLIPTAPGSAVADLIRSVILLMTTFLTLHMILWRQRCDATRAALIRRKLGDQCVSGAMPGSMESPTRKDENLPPTHPGVGIGGDAYFSSEKADTDLSTQPGNDPLQSNQCCPKPKEKTAAPHKKTVAAAYHDDGPDTETATLLRSLGVAASAVRELADMPLHLVQMVVMSAEMNPAVRSVAGWTVARLRQMQQNEEAQQEAQQETQQEAQQETQQPSIGHASAQEEAQEEPLEPQAEDQVADEPATAQQGAAAQAEDPHTVPAADTPDPLAAARTAGDLVTAWTLVVAMLRRMVMQRDIDALRGARLLAWSDDYATVGCISVVQKELVENRLMGVLRHALGVSVVQCRLVQRE